MYSDTPHGENDYHVISSSPAIAIQNRRAVRPDSDPSVDVPAQYFQSVIAIELAVAGALLWQMRFFETSSTARRYGEHLPSPPAAARPRLVLGATLFGSLWAMANEGESWAATAVTVGLALSLLPILLRVPATTGQRHSDA